MASLILDFLPPTDPGITKLHIFESPTQGGTFMEVESTTEVGTYPNYITRYTVQDATSITDWFAIQWEYEDSVLSEVSSAIQGGTTTLVQTVIDRVLLRDPSLNENVVAQEAETTISIYFGVEDPYSVDSAVAPRVLSGLTYMTMARCYTARMVTATQAVNWTAGSVQMEVATGTQAWDNIEKLVKVANHELERNYSVFLLIKEAEVAGGMLQIVAEDISRSIIEVE